MSLARLFRIVLPVVALASLAHAGPVIFQRAMPTGAGVNNANDALRSNIKWEPTGAYFIGDDFSVPTNYIIDSLTVWMVANETSTTKPSDEMSQINLYGGNDAGLNLLSSTYTYAAGPFSYLNPARNISQPIFAITFSGLNWAVAGGQLYDFGVEGIPKTNQVLSLAASNAALSNSQQDGADGFFLLFDSAPPRALLGGIDSGADELWSKSSDINVSLTAVPEPATISLIGFGVAALFLRRRRQGER